MNTFARWAVSLLLAVTIESQDSKWGITFEQNGKFNVLKVEDGQVKVGGASPNIAGSRPGTARLAPDGKHWVYVQADQGVPQIWVCDENGGQAKQLTQGPSASYMPVWSPDSKRIVFTSNRAGTTQIWVITANGENPQQLTHTKDGSSLPHFSPKGDRVAYRTLSDEQGVLVPSGLSIIDLQQKAEIAVVKNVRVEDFAWNPEGSVIVYSALQKLVFFDLDANKPTKEVKYETIDQGYDYHVGRNLIWRPDGKAVACSVVFFGSRERGSILKGDTEICVIRLDGKGFVWEVGIGARPLDWVRE